MRVQTFSTYFLRFSKMRFYKNEVKKNLNLISESVKRSALSLECIDDICSLNCLPLGMFGVGNGISHHVLKEHTQNSANLKINNFKFAI